jgi:chorismate dehydratase
LSSEITVAAVSFLNARPLVDGLEDEPGIRVVTDVPSRLLDTVVTGKSDIALCPVIDFQLAPVALEIVPAGAIGSDGHTRTVRVFSRVPMTEVGHVYVDGDSHTSVALLRVVFDELYGRNLRLSTFEGDDVNGTDDPPDSVLLIGDKVVRNAPDPALFPYQLDLGAAWKDLTGLPFVFACWMARADCSLDGAAEALARRRDINRQRITEIVAAHAQASGWNESLATEYLGKTLRYDVGPRELEAIEVFWQRCHALGLINHLRPMRLYSTHR